MEVLFVELKDSNEANPRIADLEFLPRKEDIVYWGEPPSLSLEYVNPRRRVVSVVHYPWDKIEACGKEFDVKVKVVVRPLAEVKQDFGAPNLDLSLDDWRI